MKNKLFICIITLVFIAFTLFTFFSTKIEFHDTPEYIAVAKHLAGYYNGKVYSTHSFVYTFFVAQFLKIFPSLFTIKFLNMVWIFLVGLLLYFFYKSKKMLLLWLLSPFAWIMSIQFSPILPTAFFVLLMYIAFKKWEIKKSILYLIISGFSAGLCVALYGASLFVVGFFTIIFFYKKSFRDFFLFSIFLFLGFSIRFLLDYYLVGFPFYSSIRYFGINLLIALGIHTTMGNMFYGITGKNYNWILLFIISPLLFYIYKINFKKYQREIIFVLLSFLFFFMRSGQYKYAFLFSPLIIVMLCGVLTKNQFKVSYVLSIIIIVLLVSGLGLSIFPKSKETSFIFKDYFSDENIEKEVNEDLYKIISDYNFNKVHVSKLILLNSWIIEGPEFIREEEKELYDSNKTYFSKYEMEIKPKRIDLYKQLEIKAGLKRFEDHDLEGNIPLVLVKEEKVPVNYTRTKCYDILCVYEK
jgi:hypothetical protein